ncbi:MAG: YncE family protein [Planctomycetota bacterium JB042]
MPSASTLVRASIVILASSVPAFAAPQSLQTYGTETPGTGGVAPEIWALGSPYVGNTQFAVRLERALANSTAFLLVGTQKVDVPSSFHINVLPFFLTPGLPTGPAGSLLLPLPIPPLPAIQGARAYLQWAVSDPIPAFGTSASKGLESGLTDVPLAVSVGSSSVASTVDVNAGTVGTWPAIGTHPSDVEFTPDGSLAVVPSDSGGVYHVVDVAANGAILASVPVNGRPNAVAITPDGKRCYGASYGSSGAQSGEIVEIDIDPASATFGTIVGNVAIGGTVSQFEGASISEDGRVLVAASLGLGQPSWLVAVDIDPQSPGYNQVFRAATGSGLWTDVVPSPDGSLAYLTQANIGPGSTVLVYDLSTGLPIGGVGNVGDFATDIDISHDGRVVWVATPNSSSIARIVVDPSDPAYLQPATAPVPSPFSLALTPDETEVWAAEQSGSMHRLDAATLTPIQSYPTTPNAGNGIAVR